MFDINNDPSGLREHQHIKAVFARKRAGHIAKCDAEIALHTHRLATAKVRRTSGEEAIARERKQALLAVDKRVEASLQNRDREEQAKDVGNVQSNEGHPVEHPKEVNKVQSPTPLTKYS